MQRLPNEKKTPKMLIRIDNLSKINIQGFHSYWLSRVFSSK